MSIIALLIYHPAAWHLIIDGFKESLIDAHSVSACDVIAGVAVGGVPHSSALALHVDAEAIGIYPSKKAKASWQSVSA